MQPERGPSSPSWRDEGWLRLALLLWIVALVAVSVRVLLEKDPWSRNVYPVFAEAAEHWRNGQDLYFLPTKAATMALYRYSPLAAALVVPLSVLPVSAGSIAWRVLNYGVYLGAFVWWLRAVFPWPLSRNQLGVMLLLIAPLSLGCLNNGQSNPLVLGLLLATVAAAADLRWGVAALCCVLAVTFKLYPLAVGMLLGVAYPRQFIKWLVVGLLASLALPFALQRWDYVLFQYQDWLRYLAYDDRNTMTIADANRDFRLLLRVWAVDPGNTAYLAMQLGSAALCAALCLAARLASWPERRLLNLVLSVGCCWMVLFGPATESCTYILLAPTLAGSVMEAWLTRSTSVRLLPFSSMGLFLFILVANWFPLGGRPLQQLGVHPLAGCLLTLGLLYQEYHWYRASRRPSLAAEVPLARAA